MEYLFCKEDNFEDFASGRVLYGGKGIPNFPVRLLNEIYGRARSYSQKKTDLSIYDPCCGGGYALTVLGFCHNNEIGRLYGSDIDENMIAHAKKNTALLTEDGIQERMAEIRQLYAEFGKSSHQEALVSCEKLQKMCGNPVQTEIFMADCTKPLPHIVPDLIITDVPYGNLVEWENGQALSIDEMLEQLWRIAHEETILAVCMDKKQRLNSMRWKRLEKQNVGKRRFEILKRVAD